MIRFKHFQGKMAPYIPFQLTTYISVVYKITSYCMVKNFGGKNLGKFGELKPICLPILVYLDEIHVHVI